MGNQTTTVAEYRYPSGNAYSGSMSGRKRHGPGTLVWADGARYEGDWVNDEMHGNGAIRFPNGSEYRGAFSHNNPYGFGTLTTVNGERLTGEWQFQGRAAGPSGPVGKYFFSGDVFDPNATKREHYSGPLTLHLMTGLVALPGMSDATAYVMPYASVAGQPGAATAAEGRKILQEAYTTNGVPQATVVEQAPASIAYGYQDPALLPKHPDDHAAYDLADPRLYLNSLGITALGHAQNFNQAKQQQVRQTQQYQQQQQQQAPPNVVFR